MTALAFMGLDGWMWSCRVINLSLAENTPSQSTTPEVADSVLSLLLSSSAASNDDMRWSIDCRLSAMEAIRSALPIQPGMPLANDTVVQIFLLRLEFLFGESSEWTEKVRPPST